MLIDRTILYQIRQNIDKKDRPVIILYGPRQSGKTTLINRFIPEIKDRSTYLTGDDLRTQDLLGKQDLSLLRKSLGNKNILIIDEAQRIENIGLTLKLLHDNLPITIIATGSSSFDLANKINEPLTGRTKTFFLYPLSIEEIPLLLPDTSITPRLEEFLRFGMYPKTITLENEEDKQNYLYELISNYLYKDLLSFENVRKPKKIIDLLSLLALQIGSEVSTSELANRLSLSKIIVEKYLDILEKMFVIINLRGFSRNLRKEIYKTSKYFFLDLGIRNALIRNFNPLNIRSDSGALFENFCIIERQKILGNHQKSANFYFWRTYDQKEIDLIEEKGGLLKAYEFKWGNKKENKAFQEFSKTYPNSSINLITPQNIESLKFSSAT